MASPSRLLRPSLLPNAARTRTYATRRPEKPPARFPDPLTTSSNAEAVVLPDGVTFIRRPPPSAPSPLSTTLAPASPLLRPASTEESNSEDPASVAVPPLLRTPRVFPSNQVLSDADFAKMRELRTSDPAKYTRGSLAKMFNCSPFLVGQKAPLEAPAHRDALQKREGTHEEARNRWGERKQMIMAIRKKRREFW